MTVHPHVFFSGNCREAMTRYQEVLGGDLDVAVHADAPPDARMPGAPPDAVVNATLVLDGGILLASDDPTGDGAPRRGVAIHHTVGNLRSNRWPSSSRQRSRAAASREGGGLRRRQTRAVGSAGPAD